MKDAIKKEIVFLDAENHRARLKVEITYRNNYPEFTMSGQFLGSHGQCIDKIKPANEAQKELVRLWTKYHLKNVSEIHNFKEHLEGVLARIEHYENQRPDKEKTEEEAILENMESEGIDAYNLDAVKAYMSLNSTDDLKDFEEAYQGEYPSDEDFARQLADDIGAVNSNAIWPNNCIDWEQAGRELMYDYSEEDGYYFRNL